MSITAIIIFTFSILSIVFAECYLKIIAIINKIESKSKQDIYKLFAYFIFIGIVITMLVIPGYFDKRLLGRDNILMNVIPVFNIGVYLLANWKRSVRILKLQSPIHKE